MKAFRCTLRHCFFFLMSMTVFAGILLFTPSVALAHGGGLNKCGCHKDHRYNPPQCHCHRAPYGGCGPECYSGESDASQTSASSQCGGPDDHGAGSEAGAQNNVAGSLQPDSRASGQASLVVSAAAHRQEGSGRGHEFPSAPLGMNPSPALGTGESRRPRHFSQALPG